MNSPHHIHLGGQAGVMLCVELPDGRRVLKADQTPRREACMQAVMSQGED
jgi:hypothetical protein